MNNYLLSLSTWYIMVLAFLLFWLAAFGLGKIFCGYCKLKWRYTPMMALVYMIIGLDLLALISLLAGALHLLFPWTIWTILGLATLPALFSISKIIATTKKIIKCNRIFTFSVALLFLFTLGSSLCYPYCWDELTYHIALPARWIMTGGVDVFLDNPYSAFPSLPQLIFRLAMECGGIKLPRMLCWGTYLLFFTGTYLLIKSYGARWKILICFLAFMFSPIFILMMREAYVEPFLLINLVGLMLLLKGSTVSPQLNQYAGKFIICGLLAGAAASVKLTGLGVAGIIFIIAATYPDIPLKSRVKYVLIPMILAGAVFCLPFYLRPFLATGNPFYPFLAGLFSADPGVLAMSEYHYAMGSHHYGVMNVSGFFTAPILLCFYEKIFDGIIFGWQFIVFFLLAVFLIVHHLRTKASLRIYGMIAAIAFFYVFWFFSSQQSRFVLPLYFLLLLPASWTLCRIEHRWRLLLVSSVLVISCFINSMWVDVRHYYISWRWVAGNMGWTAKFLEIGTRDKGYVSAMNALIDRTQNDSKIMLMFERRGLYCPRKYILATPFFQAKYFTPVPANHSSVMQVLEKNKIDYIMVGSSIVNPDHLEDYNQANLELARRVAALIGEKKLEIIWSDDCYNIFKVKYPVIPDYLRTSVPPVRLKQ